METKNFIRTIIDKDLETAKYNGKVLTRFPPEPNGYLHIGHAKSICINFGIARDYNTACNLRFDDTNPVKEDQEYIDSIIEDIKWLGFDWNNNLFYASDYFEKLYDSAVMLIKKGLAYVCELSANEIKDYRGTLTEGGKASPFRGRSVEENLILFHKMRNGEYPEGSKTLRAKIDMSSPNINMRDPAIYRIKFAEHHRTGSKWCIYPMYDFTHCLSDAFECITHSICTLEFEDHRPLYDWFIESVAYPWHPQQIEFARLNLKYTVMSKRKLLDLVNENFVSGWDDPRMPTIAGMRCRGYTPKAIRSFCETIGVSKAESVIDVEILENAVRDDLNTNSQRVLCVVNPLKLVIENYPEDKVEFIEAVNNPNNENSGTRKIPFSKNIYIEREDFMEDAPNNFFRLKPGGEVRLKYAYIIKCKEVIKDAQGNILEIKCEYYPETIGGKTPIGRKIKGTIHWASATESRKIKLNIYDRLFNVENPSGEPEPFTKYLNPSSLKVIEKAYIEPDIDALLEKHKHFQFERIGYFYHSPDNNFLTFNKVVSLKDTWAKIKN